MGQKIVNFMIGKDVRNKTIGVKFPEPTKEISMPAEVALEFARQLILTAREIQTEYDGQRALDRLVKDITQ